MPETHLASTSYEFTKRYPVGYFELLTLAKVSEDSTLSSSANAENISAENISAENQSTENQSTENISAENISIENQSAENKTTAINTLNQVSTFQSIHKRILPLLNNKAHTLQIFTKLSAHTQQILTSATQQGIVTELARNKQLNDIISTLAQHNIPIIILKGAAFAGTLYSKNAPRTSNDLDILIQQQHWQQAVTAIKGLMSYTQKPQPDVFGDLYELSFLPNSATGAALDLHSALIHPLLFSINEQQLWQNSIQHPSYNNELVRILSAEHSLIHQAIHAYKDMNFAKYNLIDSAEIINQQKPNLAHTIETAREWGASVPLFVLLKNCQQIMNVNIGDDLLKPIQPPFISQQLLRSLLRSNFTQPLANKKPLRYRVNQIVGQFVFTASVTRPLSLQWLFLKSVIQNR